jgi:hypothetical protein
MTLLQLLQIICEDLIPYYSKHSSDKTITRYRTADSKVKSESKKIINNAFHVPIDDIKILFNKDIDFIYYFGLKSIYQINPIDKTCTCRWNLAYETCKHIYKYVTFLI